MLWEIGKMWVGLEKSWDLGEWENMIKIYCMIVLKELIK